MSGKALGVMMSIDAVADPAAVTGAANAGATATAIAAAVPSAPPNVDEDGITAGAFIDRATRRAFVTTVLSMRTHAIEIDLDYEALLVDVNLLRTQADKSTIDLAVIRTNQIAILTALKELELMD